MAKLKIRDLKQEDHLSTGTMVNVAGGVRMNLSGLVPYVEKSNPLARPGVPITVYNVNTLNQYIANTQNFLINQTAIVDVDAQALDGSNLGINIGLGQQGLPGLVSA